MTSCGPPSVSMTSLPTKTSDEEGEFRGRHKQVMSIGVEVAAKAAIGALGWYWIVSAGLDKQLFILAGGFIAFGLIQIVVGQLGAGGHTFRRVRIRDSFSL